MIKKQNGCVKEIQRPVITPGYFCFIIVCLKNGLLHTKRVIIYST